MELTGWDKEQWLNVQEQCGTTAREVHEKMVAAKADPEKTWRSVAAAVIIKAMSMNATWQLNMSRDRITDALTREAETARSLLLGGDDA